MSVKPSKNIEISLKSLCLSQVGINAKRLTGKIERIRMVSTVSFINAETVGNNTMIKGIARQCNRHTDESVRLRRDSNDELEGIELCKIKNCITGMKDKFHVI